MRTQGQADESQRVLELQRRIDALEQENVRLRQFMEVGQKVDAYETGVPQQSNSLSSVQTLSNAEIERYSRQLLLSNGFGVDGQKKLLCSSVCVIGAGGIGSTGKSNDWIHRLQNSRSLKRYPISNSVFGRLWGRSLDHC